jgi:hypothetical protein
VCAGVGFFSEAFGPAIGTAALDSAGVAGLAAVVLLSGLICLASVTWLKRR